MSAYYALDGRVMLLLDQNMVNHFDSCPGGMPESALIDSASDQLVAGEMFVDVGAHVGTWALRFAQRGMRVEAFEPNHWIHPLLSNSVLVNGYDRMRVHAIALSDRDGQGRLQAPGIDGGMGSLVCRFQGAAVDEDVLVAKLDDFNLAPKMLKVDVEGAELDVLRGGYRTIMEHRPLIFFECWEDERGQRRLDLFDYVTSTLGYKLERTFHPEMWQATP